MEIIVFIIIIFVLACKRTVPKGYKAIIRRNDEIIATYHQDEKFYINPFLDQLELIDIYTNKPVNSNQMYNYNNNNNNYNSNNTIRPANKAVSARKSSNTFTIRKTYLIKSKDFKSISVEIDAFVSSTREISISTQNFIEDRIKQQIVQYYQKFNADDISENATIHELKLFDLLKPVVASSSHLKLENFEITPSNARTTTRNTTNKPDCVHYDNKPATTSSRRPSSIHQDNAIKEGLIDTIRSNSQDPISSSDYEYNDDPIIEKQRLSDIFGTPGLIDVNNMDSNIDPIDNK